jgi:SAM-dependent methyltransferase
VPVDHIDRERPSCDRCHSTVRMRAVIHTLSMELFGKSLPLPEFPRRNDLRGLGISDWSGYADTLARKLDYSNTFYHREPFLDLKDVPGAYTGKFDFIICSDVLEHVEPPVNKAIVNLYRMLSPNGVLLLTVPYTLGEGGTLEHFPELHRYTVIYTPFGKFLLNLTRDLRVQGFKDLVFHGGTGSTLEMRVFTRDGLLLALEAAGFSRILIHEDPYPEFGILWKTNWSLPISGQKQPTKPGRDSALFAQGLSTSR